MILENIVPGIGVLVHNLFWTMQKRLILFGEERTVNVIFDGEPNEELEPEQIDAYLVFNQQQLSLLIAAEEAIYQYYLHVMPEYRQRFGDVADLYAPAISNQGSIAKLVALREVYFPYSFDSGERTVGLLFDCQWEVEHGLAVKYINERIVDVGYQDIIL